MLAEKRSPARGDLDALMKGQLLSSFIRRELLPPTPASAYPQARLAVFPVQSVQPGGALHTRGRQF